MDLDVSQLDKAGESIDRLIESRAAERARAELWAESVRRHDLRRAAELRLEWIAYHRHRAALFEDLAEHHRQAAGRLIDEAAR